MTDFIGQELHIGDIVAYSDPYGTGKSLNLGKIQEFTKTKVRIFWLDDLNDDSVYDPTEDFLTLKDPSGVCKININGYSN